MTKVQRVGAISVAVMFAALLGFAGLKYYGSNPTEKPSYSSDLDDLRTRFNRDKGKVRLLMLLSPT